MAADFACPMNFLGCIHHRPRCAATVLDRRCCSGKREVEIRTLEPVGSYAVQPVFSDGHSTGIYSWEYLYDLGERQERLWSEYLAKLEKAGASRDK
jgi:DUF971 family protein